MQGYADVLKNTASCTCGAMLHVWEYKERETSLVTFASNPLEAMASFDGSDPTPSPKPPPPPSAMVLSWLSVRPAPELQPSWRLWKTRKRRTVY